MKMKRKMRKSAMFIEIVGGSLNNYNICRLAKEISDLRAAAQNGPISADHSWARSI